MVQRDALHAARLLTNRLRRLNGRRANQIDAVVSAFRADLLAIIQDAEPWLRELVRSALKQDADDFLFVELVAAIEQLDPHERRTDPPPAPLQLTAGGAPEPRMPRPGVRARALVAGVTVYDPVVERSIDSGDGQTHCIEPNEAALALAADTPAVVGQMERDMLGEMAAAVAEGVDVHTRLGHIAPGAIEALENELVSVEVVAFNPALPVQAGDFVVDANGVRHDGLRYPEPGEPARVLDDGVTVVVDEAALGAMG